MEDDKRTNEKCVGQVVYMIAATVLVTSLWFNLDRILMFIILLSDPNFLRDNLREL